MSFEGSLLLLIGQGKPDCSKVLPYLAPTNALELAPAATSAQGCLLPTTTSSTPVSSPKSRTHSRAFSNRSSPSLSNSLSVLFLSLPSP
eukprot:IDg4460t1